MKRIEAVFRKEIRGISALLILLLASSFGVSGQFVHSTLMDAGSGSVSQGVFFRPSSVLAYNHEKYFVNGGVQLTFSGAERKVLSGSLFSLGKYFSIKDRYFSGNLFYLVNPYSSLTKERNFGLLLSHFRSHIDIYLGYHMRLYTLDRNDPVSAGLPQGTDMRIWEYRNFIYRGTLKLKSPESPWNLYLSVTNMDNFLLQQETNPMVFTGAAYKFTDAITACLEVWYQGAGMLNLSANHYGYYIRTGLIWLIGG